MVELDPVPAAEGSEAVGTEGPSVVSNKYGRISGRLEMPEKSICNRWRCSRCHWKSKKMA
jgi:hypothetical protein